MRKSSIIFSFFVLVVLLSFNLTVNAEENPSVGQTYRSWVDNTPINNNFGEAEVVAAGIGTEKKVLIKDSWLFGNKKYASIPDTMYIVYKFPVRINVRIERLSSDYIYVPAGVTKTSSYKKQAEYA